jgi:hypothetical protein
LARRAEPEPTSPTADETKNATNKLERKTQPRRRSTRPAPLDLDTVRLEHSADPGAWRVLAGDTEHPTSVGYLYPQVSVRDRKKWLARYEDWTTVHGGPWSTRRAAPAPDCQRPQVPLEPQAI